MIVGGYDLHLYCAGIKCENALRSGWKVSTAEYAARNEREAMQEARRDGWTFRAGECYCKVCSK